jgi:hypothetical protein
MSDQFTAQNQVTFNGTYSGGATLGNHTVTVNGPGWSGTTVTDSSGHWSFVEAMPATGFGTITATIDDPASNQAQVTVNKPTTPSITDFTATARLGGVYEFTGLVIGTPGPNGMVITFGGIPALVGQTATVNSQGQFDVCFNLNGEIGNASATTTDWWGQTSTTVYEVIA